jgi:hypothetical protein
MLSLPIELPSGSHHGDEAAEPAVQPHA